MNIPQIQINITPQKIGLDTELAKLQIKQPKADINTDQEYAKVSITTTSPKINIDQTDAFKALGRVPQTEFIDIITDNYQKTGINGIKKIAEKGEHFQKIHLYNDPIVAHAKNDKVDFSAYDYVGRASCDNVDIDVRRGDLSMEWSGGTVNSDVQVNKPKLNFINGNVNIYERQKGKVDIIPPKIDITI